MDIVSFHTAMKLKEAGFHQPKIEDGQFWYNESMDVMCIGHTTDSWGEIDYFSHFVYAPSAIEIVRDGGMTMAKLTWMNASDGMDWMCENGDEEFFDKNPAEAAAEAWLEYHNK